MTIQWTVIAFILYVEIAVLLILLLPWIRPSWWKKLFNSRFVAKIKHFSRVYSYAATFVLLLLFFDAIREVQKYTQVDINLDHRRLADADAVIHMRLFRAQRNLYISGFVLLLFLVIKRIVGLLARSAQLETAAEAAFNHQDTQSKSNNEDFNQEFETVRQGLLEKIKDLEADRNNFKTRSENLQTEFDRVENLLKTNQRTKDD